MLHHSDILDAVRGMKFFATHMELCDVIECGMARLRGRERFEGVAVRVTSLEVLL